VHKKEHSKGNRDKNAEWEEIKVVRKQPGLSAHYCALEGDLDPQGRPHKIGEECIGHIVRPAKGWASFQHDGSRCQISFQEPQNAQSWTHRCKVELTRFRLEIQGSGLCQRNLSSTKAREWWGEESGRPRGWCTCQGDSRQNGCRLKRMLRSNHTASQRPRAWDPLIWQPCKIGQSKIFRRRECRGLNW